MGAIEVKETYRYQNAAGRATRRDTTVGSTVQFAGASFTLSQSWNELGLPASVTYPSSASVPGAPTRVIANTYTAGRLTGVAGYAAISYQPTGLVDEITHGTSGVTETWQPDPNGMPRPKRIEVTSPSGALWTYGDYAYDGAGNITAIGNRTFGYDAMSRLISWKDTTPTGYTTVERTLDSFGNQLSSEWTGCTTVALGDCVSTRFKPFTAAASNHYAHQTHDDGGNVIADGVHQYGYDGTGMMTSISLGGRNDRYLYTAGGERIATVSRLQAGGTLRNRTTWTLRNTGNQLLRTFNDDSTSGTRVWSWTEDEIWRGTQLLASESPTGRKQYHVDHLGSPRFVTSTAGLRLGEQPFTPFGFGGTSDGGRIQFAGQEVDVAGDGEGLMYMHARYYNPGLGRFLSVDPVMNTKRNITTPQRWNRYAYALNNPLLRVDPDGKDDRIFVVNTSNSGVFNNAAQARLNAAVAETRFEGRVEVVGPFATAGQVQATLGNADRTDMVAVIAHSGSTKEWAPGKGGMMFAEKTGQWMTGATLAKWASSGSGPGTCMLAGCNSAQLATTVSSGANTTTLGTTANVVGGELGMATAVALGAMAQGQSPDAAAAAASQELKTPANHCAGNPSCDPNEVARVVAVPPK